MRHETPPNGIRVLPAPKLEHPEDAAPDTLEAMAVLAGEIKRHKWLAIPLAAMMGIGGAGAGVYATTEKATTAPHRTDEALGSKVEANSARIREVSEDIQDLTESVDTAIAAQSDIASGIRQLKAESLDQLKSDLADAKRELRRRDR